MEFAFLDESGDPGGRGSKYQVVGLMCTQENKRITKIIRKTKQRLLQKNKSARWLNKKGGEIKWHGFPDDALLRRTLKQLSGLRIKVYGLAFDKAATGITESDKTHILGSLFDHIKSGNSEPAKVIADMSFFKQCGDDENIFLLLAYETDNGTDGQKKIEFSKVRREDYEILKNDDARILIRVEHKNSKDFEELQALDLICGAIFESIEYDNSTYLDIMKSGVIDIRVNILSRTK